MREYWFTTAQRRASWKKEAENLANLGKINSQMCRLLFCKESPSDSKSAPQLPAITKKLLSRLHELSEKEQLPVSRRICPECGKAMELFRLLGFNLDGCRRCKSYWFDAGELREFTRDSEDIPAESLGLRHRATQRPCPRCRCLMRELQFARGSNLLVDTCPNGHGVYLQSGELARVLQIA